MSVNQTVSTQLFYITPTITPTADLSTKSGYFGKLSSGLPVVCDSQGERPDFVIVTATSGGAASFAATPGQIVQLVAGGSVTIGAELTTTATGTAEAASSNDAVFAKALAAASSGEAFRALIVSAYIKA